MALNLGRRGLAVMLLLLIEQLYLRCTCFIVALNMNNKSHGLKTSWSVRSRYDCTSLSQIINIIGGDQYDIMSMRIFAFVMKKIFL